MQRSAYRARNRLEHRTGEDGASLLQWQNYQSAIQLVVAGNLALFAFPALRKPALDFEQRALNAAVERAEGSGQDATKAYADRSGFVSDRSAMDHDYARAKATALLAAVFGFVVLGVATADANGRPPPPIPWLAILLGLCPAVWCFWLNARAGALVLRSRKRRGL
jgi:hypothetical protein